MEDAADFDFSASNEELLELCKRQDQDALRLLFRRHERPVYNLLMRMLSNHDDAEEALAEVFVKVWRAAASFKGESKFSTWLFRIASNTARDKLRSRRCRPEVSMQDVIIDEIEAGQRTGSALGDPVKTTLEAENKAIILKAIQGLNEEDRTLIVLYHFRECDYDEMAEIIGIPPSNLKVKLFRARQKLKRICSEQEKDNDTGEMRRDTTESSGLRQGAADWA